MGISVWLFGRKRRWVNLYHPPSSSLLPSLHHHQQDDNYLRDCVLFAVAFTYASRFCEFCIKPKSQSSLCVFFCTWGFSNRGVGRVFAKPRERISTPTPRSPVFYDVISSSGRWLRWIVQHTRYQFWKVEWAVTRAELVKLLKTKVSGNQLTSQEIKQSLTVYFFDKLKTLLWKIQWTIKRFLNYFVSLYIS